MESVKALRDSYQEQVRECERLLKLAGLFANQLLHHWHTVTNDEPSLAAWMGLSREQYAAFAEKGVGETLTLTDQGGER